MGIYCSNCGTQQPDNASFCMKCGKPLLTSASRSGAISAQQVEYQEFFIDLSKPPLVSYEPLYKNWQESHRKYETLAHQRVDAVLQPYLAQGWILDGPFDSAVEIQWEDRGAFIHKSYLKGARIRLRRYLGLP